MMVAGTGLLWETEMDESDFRGSETHRVCCDKEVNKIEEGAAADEAKETRPRNSLVLEN